MKSLYRSLYSDWKSVPIKHGIAPTKVWPSKFIRLQDFPGYVKYWRDVPSRASMFDRINGFFENRTVSVNYDILDRATEYVSNMWVEHYGQDNRLLTLKKSADLLPSSTSAGLPFSTGVKKGEVKRSLLRMAAAQWTNIKKGKTIKIMPCRSGARRQLREVGKNKPRLIWAYPGYLSILENQFVGVLQQYDPPKFMGWSINWLDYGRSLERVTFNSGLRWGAIAQLDFSSFDATIPEFLIHKAFNIVKMMFNLSREEKIMLDNLKYYFIHTPILFYETIIVKHRGIPSGSTFTQLIGSICNMIMCKYADLVSWYSFGLCLKDSCWLGDDSLLFFREGIAKEEFNDRYLKYFDHFGVEVNEDKSNYVVRNSWTYEDINFCSMSVKFLGRAICPDCKCFKLSFSKFDAQVAWPESEDKTVHDTGTRLIGLVWAYGMYYDTYTKLAVAFKRLNLPNNRVSPELVTGLTNRDVSRFLTMFVGHGGDVPLSFPTFEEVSDRYFDNVHISRSYRTKNMDITRPRPV
nr:RNA-dependent RNA polymerase [Partitiviridae sp.]